LRLTGTADEQYREWQKLLHELYLEENGGAAPAAAPAPTTSATSAGTSPPVTPVKVAVEQPATAHP
jgi:hypothetical protein